MRLRGLKPEQGDAEGLVIIAFGSLFAQLHVPLLLLAYQPNEIDKVAVMLTNSLFCSSPLEAMAVR